MQSKAPLSRKLVILTAVFAALSGLYLLIGGIWLAKLGGSFYYIIAGVVELVVAWLLFRRRSSALMLYAVFLLATLIWSLWEVGSDFWALTPRLDVTFFLGLWLVLPFVYRGLSDGKAARGALSAVLVVTVIALAYAVFNDPQEINGSLSTEQAANVGKSADGIAAGDWPAYGRTQAGTRYSPLTQITDKNVGQLKEAWTFRTGDMKRPTDPGEMTDEVTPIKIGDSLYLCTPHQILFALDAATGKEKWKFDPQLKTDPSFQHVTCRGVSYHETPAAANVPAGGKPALCARRVILPVNDGHLYSLDAETGALCPEFGENGKLNLQQNMPNARAGAYEPTSPPIVTDTTIVVAGAVTDNYSTKEPSGVVRGFDVNTGKLLWAFDPGAKDPNVVPEGEQHYVANSPNSWAPAAYDAKLDLVYLPIGVATPDIWGGNRTPEMERYATGMLALNATTGKVAWFYQTVHHDLWDMDVPAQPTLADITDKSGNSVPVIYVPTKTGDIFVLDRRSGKEVVPAPETPVPQGPAKGDRLSPTQHFSELTYRPKNKLSGADMWGATIYDQLMCRVMFHSLRYEGPFTPPSEQGTLVFPGNLGMFEWGGISVNTDRQIAVTNPMALPFVSRLIPRGPNNPMWPNENDKGGSGSETGVQPQYGVPYGVTLNPFLSPLGFPCKQPAWGYISAVDLKTNDIVWKKRIGTVRDSSPVPLPFKMGMPMLGGPISTAGNVMFIGATADNYLRAFNVTNGEKLWEARLPAGGQATPMTYEVNGKQYVLIAAGGHGSFGTKLGDYIVAYALPDDAK
ncbi:glucose/quinate/shikimate family membrane-bound PQQ-dependent dehydrogenase [Erwinia sp.]|uniref:glucose/quinate/shikimate family membrane-bound PQQ-dependent dehydrogenase n=1 Tax=Erwinia citreus TaxID=558 RepID=UPI00289A5ADC|nr:glucose/quinate/shikimate family membrane-bound PQQ-dependent dehydrogenase [Erwinia sp.]